MKKIVLLLFFIQFLVLPAKAFDFSVAGNPMFTYDDSFSSRIDSSSYTQNISTLYTPDGTTYSRYGNTVYSSTYTKHGNTLYSSTGITCSTYGNTTYCN